MTGIFQVVPLSTTGVFIKGPLSLPPTRPPLPSQTHSVKFKAKVVTMGFVFY